MSFACRRVLTALVASAGIAAAVPVFALEVHDDVEPHHGWNQFPIDVLSSRPDTVSGGDSLIQVGVRKNVALSQMRIKLNGTDITAMFLANNATRTLTGLVTGLKLGENLLEVALEWGCKVSIDTDAHAPGQLEWQNYGCDKAARHEIDPSDVVNTWAADDLIAWTDTHPTA